MLGCCVVKEKFRHSFVLPKNIVLEKLTISRTAIIANLDNKAQCYTTVTMLQLAYPKVAKPKHWKILATRLPVLNSVL